MGQFSDEVMLAMGYSLMPEGRSFTARFKRLEVYEIDGVRINNPAFEPRKTIIEGYDVAVSLGASLNAVCNATEYDNFVDNEDEWRSNKKCSGPVLLISIGPTKPYTGYPKFATIGADTIHTYDSFSEAKTELREASKRIVPLVFAAFSASGTEIDPKIKLTRRDVAFFGIEGEGATVLDSYVAINMAGSLLSSIADEDAERFLNSSLELLSRVKEGPASFLHLGLQEDNSTQRFLLLFISIERSTHLSYKLNKPEVLGTQSQSLGAGFEWNVRNTWRALGEGDERLFKKLKLTRDKLAHGELTRVTDTEVSQVESLAKKVLIAVSSSYR